MSRFLLGYKGEDKQRHFFYYYKTNNYIDPHTIIYTELPPNITPNCKLEEAKRNLNVKGWISLPRIDFRFNDNDKTGNFYLNGRIVLTLTFKGKYQYDSLNDNLNNPYEDRLKFYNEALTDKKTIDQYLHETMNYPWIRPTNVDEFFYYFEQLEKMVEDGKIDYGVLRDDGDGESVSRNYTLKWESTILILKIKKNKEEKIYIEFDENSSIILSNEEAVISMLNTNKLLDLPLNTKISLLE